MSSIRSFLCIFVGILLVACGSQATPTPMLNNTATVEPSLTMPPRSTSISQPSAPSSTAVPADCARGWTQLIIGAFAKVAGADNDPPNRVRSEPIKGDNIIAQIYPGAIVKIIEGPVCADNLVYWKVENASIPGGIGWTAEGDGSEYWLETYTYLPESVLLSAYGVSFSVPGSWSNIPDADVVRAGSDEYCTWPEHIKVTLTTYPAQSEWKPILYVYITAQLPDWYPICPGAPLLRVHHQTLSHGERLIVGSKNAQPIFNSELIYTYEGQTLDGKHTIIAFFPVNFPYLAYSFKNLDLPLGGIPFNLENQDWDAYYQAVGAQLEAASDSDFNPRLDLLDAVAESIFVVEP